MKVWGHRGAMDFAPQNTIPAFLLAQDQGADGVELDVQLTRDGVLVVFHDALLDSLTDGRGPLSAQPWSQVRKLDAGSHFGRNWKDTRIPTLEEVLMALAPHMTVNVELKTDLPGQARPLAEATAKILEKLPAARFVVSSFDPFALEAFAPLLPQIVRGFLDSPNLPRAIPPLMRAAGYQAWHPHHSQVSMATVTREKSQGRSVHVWTVNDPGHAAGLAKTGVDAVITNRPRELLSALGR